MTDMCKSIGVQNSLIQMATKLNDWDIIRTSQDFALKCKMIEKEELIALLLITDKRLKESEKLKNKIDLNHDRDKKVKEDAERKRLEIERQNEVRRKESIEVENELKRKYQNSDYVAIINRVSNEFNDWLKKSEFEKTDDYNQRMNSRELKFKEICNNSVLKQLQYQTNFSPEAGSDVYQSDIESSFKLLDYNADKELFPFVLKYKFIEFKDTINISFNDAQQFKKQTNYQNVHLPKQAFEYGIIDNYIYPKKLYFDNIQGKSNVEIELNFSLPMKSISFSTEELKLSNYTFEKLEYNLKDFKR
jgi:hypothetical protein